MTDTGKRVRSQYKKGSKRHCIPSAEGWPFNVQDEGYRKAFYIMQRRARSRFLEAMPPAVPGADKVKIRGLAGLKTLEEFILNETQPTVNELQALQKIGDLVRLIVPGFRFQYLSNNTGAAVASTVGLTLSAGRGDVNGAAAPFN